MVTIADAKGQVAYVNPQFTKFSGFTKEEILGKPMPPLSSLSAAERQKTLKNLKSGSVWRTEYLGAKKSGKPFWESVSISAVFKKSGAIAFFIKFSQDISERKSKETSLSKSEKKYRAIIDSFENGYYEVDLKGNFTLCNNMVANIIGVPREKLIGLNYKDYRATKDTKKLRDLFDNVYKTGQTASLADHELIDKDGATIIVDLTVSLLKDESGRPVGFSGITRDRTKQIEAEKALRQSEESYRSVLALAPDVITISRIDDGTYLEVNDTFTQISGFTAEEAIGKTSLELNNFYDPTDRDLIVEGIRQRGRVDGLEIKFNTKDKSVNYALLSCRPITFRGEKCLLTITTLITSLKEAEKARLENQKKYRQIIESFQEGYYEVDLAGNFIFFNAALCKAYGYSAEKLMGMNNKEYTSSQTVKKAGMVFRQVYCTGIPAEIDNYEVVREDGTIVTITLSVSLLRDEKGKPMGFYGISRDVTKKRKLQQALRESERKYRTILENIEEGYFEVDLAGNLTFGNDALCKTYGYPYEEIIGINNREYTSPETAKKIFDTFSEVYRTGITSSIIDYEIIRKDDSVVMIETAASLLKDANGTPTGFHGIVRDRTEQKKAELALKESEESYRLLVENANEGIYITQDDVVKFPNQKTEALTGFNNEELSKMSFSSLIHPKEKDSIVERMGKPLESNHLEKTFSFRIINRANETLWVELNTVEITWESRPATLNFLKDISPQKKMEAQFQQAQKMEAVGTLAGGIAHDFNNILMGVQGNASLVLLDLDADDPQAEKLRNIERLVKGGAELTKQLLGAAKGGKYEVKPTDLNELVIKGARLFGRTRKEVRIHTKFQEKIWSVEVDRNQIDQVLLNLYVNAWQAMAEGGDLYLETKNIILDDYYVRPYGVDAGNFVRISVTDTGSGMDVSTRKRVFDPFFTTKKMNRGTGLGLASAYGIVGNHKGIINVYSEIDEGTTFNIYLPISDKKISRESGPLKKIYTGTETILFVDDEEAISQLGRLLLQKLGYKVFSAESGVEAIKIYKKEKDEISLVILDMIMPGMNGGETFDKLKEINPSVKVLLSSGYSINGQAKKILDRGCKGFLQKPFNVSDFSEKLRKILDE